MPVSSCRDFESEPAGPDPGTSPLVFSHRNVLGKEIPASFLRSVKNHSIFSGRNWNFPAGGNSASAGLAIMFDRANLKQLFAGAAR
jgi:hypothetical protein